MLSQTQPDISTTAARIVREADAAVREELCRLDAADRILDQLSEFLAVRIRESRSKILDLDQPFANKNDLNHISNTAHPGIAEQLGVERHNPSRFLCVACGSGLPPQQARRPIKSSHCVHIGDKVIAPDGSRELQLQVLLRLWHFDAILLTEAMEQHDALLEHAIPRIASGELQVVILTGEPFTKEHIGRVFSAKVGA